MPSPAPLAPLLAAVFDGVVPMPTRLRPRVIGRLHPVRRVRRRCDPLVSHHCRHQLVSLTADRIIHCPHHRADRRSPGFAVTATTGSCQ